MIKYSYASECGKSIPAKGVKVRKIRFAAFFAILLALTLIFAGCQNGQGTTEAVPTEQSIEQPTESQGETLPEGVPEAAVLQSGLTQVFKTFNGEAESTALDTSVLESLSLMRGGFIPKIEPIVPEELSEEAEAEMDRAMRAYTRKDEDIIVNNSEFFYFYSQLDDEAKDIYDALELFAHDPTSTENIVSVKISSDPRTEEFVTKFYLCQTALSYDHPELWWMYPWNGSVDFGAYIGQSEGGKNVIYFQFTTPYETFERDVTAFNEAVEAFLDDIDTEQLPRTVAKEIHDKLIEMAIYDQAVLKENRSDFAHTAFGALVANTEGTPHYCVCDGYSQAYEYLLTQVGIPATVVTGMAGTAGADGGMGGHAWSLILLDGKWYEVDSTWDDFTDLKNDVAANYSPSSVEYQVYMELLNDEAHMEKIQHYMYLLMTDEIENYKAPEDLTYQTKNGMYHVQLVGDSERIRFCDYEETKDTFQGAVTRLLPQADGEIAEGFEDETEDEPETDEPETDEPETEKPTEKATSSPETGKYQSIAGTYYVSSYNGYGEQILRAYYGNDYYKQLSMFTLNADGTGVLLENGTSTPFTFQFDGTYLQMFGGNGGSLIMAYTGGGFLMYDNYWNIYIFSKMK